MTESKLTLEVQLGHGDIGSLIGAKLSDAIEAELAKIDIGALIVGKLTKPRQQSGVFISYLSSPHDNLLDELISVAISKEAKDFINRHIEANRAALEERFAAMMSGSEAKLTQAFCKAMLGALDDGDWRFEIDAKVSTPVRGDLD